MATTLDEVMAKLDEVSADLKAWKEWKTQEDKRREIEEEKARIFEEESVKEFNKWKATHDAEMKANEEAAEALKKHLI